MIKMKNRRYIFRTLTGLALSLVLLSCAKEEDAASDFSKGVPAVMDVTVIDMEQSETRRNVDQTTDHWTTKSFSVNDRIGLMATGGMVSPEGGSSWIKNAYMEYFQATGSSNYRFRNDDLLINTSMMSGKVGRYVYFPYTDEMPVPKFEGNDSPASDGSYIRYFANPNPNLGPNDKGQLDDDFKGKKGLRLRVDHDNDPSTPDRCVDYMYISNISLSNGALSGGFYHGFCELIILRGTGFETPPAGRDEIAVVLDYGYTRLTLNLHLDYATGQYSWIPRLWPNSWSSWKADDDSPAGGPKKVDGLTEEEAKRWVAWSGEKYIAKNEDGTPSPRDAWYVILPTAHSYSHTVADYIEIYNNQGDLCKVSNFDLYVNATTGVGDKQMRPGKRFAVEVMMTELGATARPVEIADWSDDDGYDSDGNKNNVTDIRTVGIKDANVLAEWAGKYNQFIMRINSGSFLRPKDKAELDEISKTVDLTPYGDYNFADGRWQFYITDNIDLTNQAIGVTELQDLIEGASRVTNYSISNLHNTWFGKISANGEVSGLDFDNLYVRSYPGEGGKAGVLTNELAGGTIAGCNITAGTLIGNSGSVGMLAGQVSGGTIENCSVSGAVIGTTFGSATYPAGLFGSEPTGSFTYRNNSAAGLIAKSN